MRFVLLTISVCLLKDSFGSSSSARESTLSSSSSRRSEATKAASGIAEVGSPVLCDSGVSCGERLETIGGTAPEIAEILRDLPKAEEGVEIHVSNSLAFMDAIPALLQAADVVRKGIQSVNYVGESGFGGGLIKDWFAEASKQLSERSSEVFVTSESAPYFLSLNVARELGHAARYLRATGRFMALALVSNQQIGLNLPVSFYARLLELPLKFEDLKTDNEELYKSLSQLLDMDNEMLADIPLRIAGVDHDLNTENVHELVELKANSMVSREGCEYFNALREAFHEIIPIDRLRRVVTPRALRDMLFGFAKINIEAMMATIDYSQGRYTKESPQIKWLHVILQTFSQAERRDFVRFVTGSAQLPAGGFAGLKERIKIVPVSADNGELPTSSTCFNMLRLPRYGNKNDLKRKLKQALEMNNGLVD
jgi:hypothetical protein